MRHWTWMCLFLSSFSWATDLRVGAAKVEITPPKGVPMGGYFYVRLNTGVHDPLYAKAVVLEKDGVKAALVVCDLESVLRPVTIATRMAIEQKTSLRGENVILSATHTHTGPEVSRVILGRVQGAASEAANAYWAALPEKIAQCVREAEANLAPARAWSAIGNEPSLVFNRRFLMKDGTVRFNPGKMNPDIVRPVGPTDPAVPVVYFDSPDSRPLATFVNYALHLDTVGGTEFSADYPFTLSLLLARVKGPEMLTLFTIGTAGNINHFDVGNNRPQQGHAEAGRIGTVLAAAVLKTFERLQPAGSGALQVKREVVNLPVRPLQPGELEKGRALIDRALRASQESDEIPFLDMVNAYRAVSLDEYKGRPIETEVQVISLGDQVAWVGLPGEVFVELGIAIKLASPFPVTSVIELCSDMIDYVPNRKAYVEGAYEVITARCQSGSGEMLVDAATRLLTDAYQVVRKKELEN